MEAKNYIQETTMAIVKHSIIETCESDKQIF